MSRYSIVCLGPRLYTDATMCKQMLSENIKQCSACFEIISPPPGEGLTMCTQLSAHTDPVTGMSFSSSLWWLFSLWAWFLGYVSHSGVMGTLWNAVIKWPRRAPSSNPSIWLFFLSPWCKGLVILLWGRLPLFAFEGHRGRNLVHETQWSFLPLLQTSTLSWKQLESFL